MQFIPHQLPVLPARSVAISLNLGVVVSGALAATQQPALTGAAAGVERHPSLWPLVTGNKRSGPWPCARIFHRDPAIQKSVGSDSGDLSAVQLLPLTAVTYSVDTILVTVR